MLSTCHSGDALEIRFESRLDTARCAEIEAEVRAAVTQAPGPVEFNLAGVDFIASSFLRLCVYTYQQTKHHGFRVTHVCPSIKRVFKIAGLDVMLVETE